MIVEFRYLAHATGDKRFAEAVEKMYSSFDPGERINGLWPVVFDVHNAKRWTDIITFGGYGDSFYEYLLKAWIQSGKKDPLLWQWYEVS